MRVAVQNVALSVTTGISIVLTQHCIKQSHLGMISEAARVGYMHERASTSDSLMNGADGCAANLVEFDWVGWDSRHFFLSQWAEMDIPVLHNGRGGAPSLPQAERPCPTRGRN